MMFNRRRIFKVLARPHAKRQVGVATKPDERRERETFSGNTRLNWADAASCDPF
jgi:hypothetical protein